MGVGGEEGRDENPMEFKKVEMGGDWDLGVCLWIQENEEMKSEGIPHHLTQTEENEKEWVKKKMESPFSRLFKCLYTNY